MTSDLGFDLLASDLGLVTSGLGVVLIWVLQLTASLISLTNRNVECCFLYYCRGLASMLTIWWSLLTPVVLPQPRTLFNLLTRDQAHTHKADTQMN